MNPPRSSRARPERANKVYTEPLGLTAHLNRPTIKLDAVPLLDLIVIALLFGLLFTRFVMVPGLQIDLPGSEMQMQPSTRPVAVLTIGNRGMLLFDGARFDLSTIERAFEAHLDAAEAAEVVLLVKSEGTLELQQFLKICSMAQRAGFALMQVVGEPVREGPNLLPAGESFR